MWYIMLVILFFLIAFSFGYLFTTGIVWLLFWLTEISFEIELDWNIWAIGGIVYVLWLLFFWKKPESQSERRERMLSQLFRK